MKKRLRIASFLLTGILVITQLGGCNMVGGTKDAALEENSFTGQMEDGIAYESMVSGTTMDINNMSVEVSSEESEIEMNTEEYNAVTENAFHKVSLQPLSTFSADVDTASYSNIRRMLMQGMAPEEISTGAVRIEEMLNYFSYSYEQPGENEVFGISIDAADCPWNQEHGLLRIGIQTEDIDFARTPESNLVFLLDVSGSMNDSNKLPLLKKAFAMLVDNLGEKDRISIVTYAGTDAIVLQGEKGNRKGEILEALQFLEAGGGTNGSAGIETAYELAEKYFIEGGNNRVILATDGDLNIGITSESDLKDIIEEKRKSGIYLSVLGFGDGNLKDNKLETLADCGNGNYAYIDTLMEAKRVLVDEMGSTLVTVAEDVKFQMEFNPAWISEYRLLGYENRLLNAQDFTDDTKDAGELGAGHTVTVLYEVVWKDAQESGAEETNLKYQDIEPAKGEAMKEWATLKIRYKEPGTDASKELVQAFGAERYHQDLEEANMVLEASIAEFGLLLRNSEYKGNASYQHILDMWNDIMYGGSREIAEFLYLIELAAGMADIQEGLPAIYNEEIEITEEIPVDESNISTENLEEDSITIQVLEETITNSGGVFLIKNNSDNEVCYGEYYEIQKMENGKWKSLKMKENVGFHDIAYILMPKKENKIEKNWEWVYGTLSPGTYRLQTDVFYSEILEDDTENINVTLTAEFEIPSEEDIPDNITEENVSSEAEKEPPGVILQTVYKGTASGMQATLGNYSWNFEEENGRMQSVEACGTAPSEWKDIATIDMEKTEGKIDLCFTRNMLEYSICYWIEGSTCGVADSVTMEGDTILLQNDMAKGIYLMCRKTPSFSYGDIRHVHRIYASN